MRRQHAEVAELRREIEGLRGARLCFSMVKLNNVATPGVRRGPDVSTAASSESSGMGPCARLVRARYRRSRLAADRSRQPNFTAYSNAKNRADRDRSRRFVGSLYFRVFYRCQTAKFQKVPLSLLLEPKTRFHEQ